MQDYAGVGDFHVVNYFREHEGLEGKTPAEAAGIKVEGDNKWITIIQNAATGRSPVTDALEK